MPDPEQRPGSRRGADRLRAAFLGPRAVSGWMLVAVLGVAGASSASAAPAPPPAQPSARAEAIAAGRLPPLPIGGLFSPSPALQPGGGTIATLAPEVPAAGPAAADTAPTGAIPRPVPGAELRQAQFTTDAPDARARLAIKTAMRQLGLPYVWGGNGPANGDAGFDCSGLTTFSYAAAGVGLPRTAHTQYNAGPHVPAGAALQPGDLVFYGTTARVRHVGMYLGAGRMVNAPTFGKPVQVAFYRYRGDNYLGATRPAAAPGSLTTGVLPYVEPVPVPDVGRLPQDEVFRAPPAPLPALLPQPGDVALPPEPQSAAAAIAESDAVAVPVPVAPAPGPAVAPPVAPAPGAPAPVDPAPVDPAPVDPAPVDPAPVAPALPGSPAPVGPAPVSPAPPAGSAPATAPPAVPGASAPAGPPPTAPAVGSGGAPTTVPSAPAAQPSAAPKPAAPKPTAAAKPAPKPTAAAKPAPKPTAAAKPAPKPTASKPAAAAKPSPAPKPAATPKPPTSPKAAAPVPQPTKPAKTTAAGASKATPKAAAPSAAVPTTTRAATDEG